MQNLIALFVLLLFPFVFQAQPTCVMNTCCCGSPVEVGVPNGNFEDPPTPPLTGRITFYAGENYGPWSVNSGSIDLLGPNYSNLMQGNPNGASNFIDLHGFTAGTITNNLTGLMPGEQYTLVLWYAINPGATLASCNIQIANGAWLNETWSATNPGGVEWLEKCYTFTAQATSAQLRFSGSSNFTTAGMLLDDITLWKCPADTDPPLLVQSALNDTVFCSNSVLDSLALWLATQGSALVADSCGPVLWSNNYNGDPTPSKIEVTFTATDACQNSISTTAFFVQTSRSDTTIQNALTCNSASVGVVVQTLTNQFGCDSVLVLNTNLMSKPQLSVSGSDFNGLGLPCTGDTNGSAKVIAAGIAPFYYAWSNGSMSPMISGLSAGNYSVTVTDGNGCTSTSMLALLEPERLQLAFTVSLDCSGTNANAIAVAPSGGAAPYQYSLDGQNYQVSNMFEGLSAGAYQITVSDANACTQSGTGLISQTAPVFVNLGPDLTIELGELLTLQASVNLPVDSLNSVVWSAPDSSNCARCLSQQVQPLSSGNYSVTVIGNNGCEATDTIRVFVIRRKQIYVPNAFSPNGDGQNDDFLIFSKPGVVRNVRQFAVYDRWGDALFQFRNFLPNDPDFGWDGTSRGQPMNPGVYVWLVEIEFVDGEQAVFSGDVLLVR